MDARRGQVYVQAFADGEPLMAAQAVAAEDAAAMVKEVAAARPMLIAGSGAALLREHLPEARFSGVTSPDPVVLAQLAMARTPSPLIPIYLRAPDAKLPL
jgi:tRNA threonylcarbamoyladenosine biosynthesis protein TsaB